MNAFTPIEEPVDLLLMDVARRVQLSREQHDAAVQHYKALCAHVDREGSPLQGMVRECYPSGSFAIGTATLSRVKTNQHDTDVVMELDYEPKASPRYLLGLLFEAINGDEESRYHGRVTQNSRCVTVRYRDGTGVDLMPVARLSGQPERAGNLFHFKRETGEEYHKPVNPWAFAEHFNRNTEIVEEFAKAFEARRYASRMMVEKAATQPMPDLVPIMEKSPRTVAVQLAKRARDVAYRTRDKRLRRPPSVVIAALALENGPVRSRLIDELIALVDNIAGRIRTCTQQGILFDVRNPAYTPDRFTDRWPENLAAQKMYGDDLREFRGALLRLRNDTLSPETMKRELEKLFGESAASYAVEGFLEDRRKESDKGSLAFGSRGRILTGAAAATAAATTARASTFAGGDCLPE